jgi:hypothetical protein
MGDYISSDKVPEDAEPLELPSLEKIMQLGTATNWTSSDCGKLNGVASGPPLQPDGGLLAINGNTDLSSCIVGKSGARVYNISVQRLARGIYSYRILVDAQGPAGIGSGSLYLKFMDESRDDYDLRISSSTRKLHFVRYNSEMPALVSVNWSDNPL